ncbi:hypothetical protein [Cohnella sp. JJ-181]|uniref:hypothetical protein n=1 Tax=Cohnella rhizoplanae TaxID=2974897 RepID=UPI0022FFAE26|nr:hypothetical protein [Cohnella sp. JJ-181]CAI6084540.1 hypothetical protein COHCIP112018_04372 [Cohnella sp. JJ-181]
MRGGKPRAPSLRRPYESDGNPPGEVPAIEVSALAIVLVSLISVACVWSMLALIVRQAIQASGTSHKLDLLTKEVRALRRELRERDSGPRDSEVRGHQVDHSV